MSESRYTVKFINWATEVRKADKKTVFNNPDFPEYEFSNGRKFLRKQNRGVYKDD